MLGVWDLNIFQIETFTSQKKGQTRTDNLVIFRPASYPLCHRSCVEMDVIISELNSITTSDII